MEDSRKLLFNTICLHVSSKITPEWITSTKTIKGNTQKSERIVIEKIKEVFTEMSLTYNEAPSQQSKDFRNIGGIGLDIEVKKTDSSVIIFNDTCPSPNIYYIIIFTGKTYKKQPDIPPQVLYMNGSDFLNGCDWMEEFILDLNKLKDNIKLYKQDKEELKEQIEVL
jgi:hypothetical protein